MTLPCAPRGDFEGWIVRNEDGSTDDDLGALTRIQSLIVGLERYTTAFAQQERAATGAPGAGRAPALTPREQVALVLVAAGSTAQGIGAPAGPLLTDGPQAPGDSLSQARRAGPAECGAPGPSNGTAASRWEG